jgi:purine-binding chemotaxis protein CheW
MNTFCEVEEKNLVGKYLAFSLAPESYAVNILGVREIIRLTEITLVPQMPKYIRGVINLRGKIVPVVELRARFGLPRIPATDRTCIIVVNVGARGLMGLIVDCVEDVLQFNSGDIQGTPEFGGLIDSECILGIARHKTRAITLLDLENLWSEETLESVGGKDTQRPARATKPWSATSRLEPCYS